MNRLTIVKELGPNKHRKILVLCKCECGKEKVIVKSSIISGRIKSCGCLHKEKATEQILKVGRRQAGNGNGNWKGGKFVNHHGYSVVYSSNYPNRGTYDLEHRLVMEKIVGRKLLPNETVHHKNGVRTDNRPENLELWSTKHPKGMRAEDLVQYAKEILELYKDMKA
jgi:hypothetical protein